MSRSRRYRDENQRSWDLGYSHARRLPETSFREAVRRVHAIKEGHGLFKLSKADSYSEKDAEVLLFKMPVCSTRQSKDQRIHPRPFKPFKEISTSRPRTFNSWAEGGEIKHEREDCSLDDPKAVKVCP